MSPVHKIVLYQINILIQVYLFQPFQILEILKISLFNIFYLKLLIFSGTNKIVGLLTYLEKSIPEYEGLRFFHKVVCIPLIGRRNLIQRPHHQFCINQDYYKSLVCVPH